MAALKVVRRPKGQPARRSLVAASQPITDPAKDFKSSASGINIGNGSNAWQEIAWEMLDLVGELRYYVGWRAASCSRVKLIASELDDDGVPTGECDNARVKEIVKAIAGGRIGQSQFVKRLVECLSVPGESWLVIIMGLPEDKTGAGTWFAISRDEMRVKGDTVTVEMPDGTKRDLNLASDALLRIWNPRPRKASQPDSPVRACLDPLREIVRTTKTISNASKSRLIGNGIVLVPHEMSLPTQATPVSADKPDGSAIPPLVGQPAVQQLQELLFQVAQTAYDDEDSMAALIPIFAGVPGDQVKNISHVKFDNEVTQLAIQTRNDAIARLAMGLDVSPERLLGLGSSTNHWSAWQIGDTDVQLHISPVMETICQAITKNILSIVLERDGIDSTKYVLWYDTGGLTSDPDKSDQATAAFDRGAITAEAYREYLNLGDSGYDFTSMTGWQEWATDKVSEDPALIMSLLPLLPNNVQGLDFPEPPPAIAPQAPDTPASGPSETNPDGSPGSENNPPPSEKETRAIDSVSAFERVFVTRALDLAGKRRITRADRGRLSAYKPHEYHRMMTPVDPSQIAELIRGWDDTLEDDVMELIGVDSEQFRARVRAEVRRQLTAQVVNA